CGGGLRCGDLFFFQAEDGIRDLIVTGVQTCALPIYARSRLGFNCSISRAEAAARVNSVADNRQSVLSQLSGVQGPTTQADDVVTRLLAALQKSIEADRHYHDGFVADAKAGCPLPTNASFRSAAQFDAEATTAKE